MDLIRNSHFQQRNLGNQQTSLTINGITIQRNDSNNIQQSNYLDVNNEEFIEILVPPISIIEENKLDLENVDISRNIPVATVPSEVKQTGVSINNCVLYNTIDLVDDNEILINETLDTYNMFKARLSSDEKWTPISIKNKANDGARVVLSDEEETPDSAKKNTSNVEIVESIENDNISKANIEIKLKSHINNDTTVSNDILTVDKKESADTICNDTNSIVDKHNSKTSFSQNISKTDETPECSKISEHSDDSMQNVTNNTIIENTENAYSHKLNNLKNEPEIVTDCSIENIKNEPINEKTEETTIKCIREFEDILAIVENKHTLKPEFTLKDVNDLILFNFDDDDDDTKYDAESQVPLHIIRKNISADLIDISDYELDMGYSNEPVEVPMEINEIDTQMDAVMITDAENGNTVTDVNINLFNDTSKANSFYTISTTALIENYETISISSEENPDAIDCINISDSSDSSDCGYHSSDFEFITEKEAKQDGLIINFRPKELKNKRITNTIRDSRPPKIRKVTAHSKNTKASLSHFVQRPSNLQAGSRNYAQIPSYLRAGPSNPVQRPLNVRAGLSNNVQIPSYVQARPSNPVQRPLNVQPGPSKLVQRPLNVQPGPSNPIQIPNAVNYECYRNKYKKQFQNDTANYRGNHNEPQGDVYLELFRGFDAGVPMFVRENKSTKTQFANPNVWYRGVGFDIPMMRGNYTDDEAEEDEFKVEANETAQKITLMFPSNSSP